MHRNIYIKRLSNLMLALLLFVTSFSIPLIANENINNTAEDTSTVGQEEENTEIDVISEETSQVEETEATTAIADLDDEPKQRVTPFISTPAGSVQIKVPAYDGVSWPASVGGIYDVDVVVDFSSLSNTDAKKVVITLPEGVRYQAYPVNRALTANTPEVTMVGVLPGFVDNIIVPERNPDYKTFNGALTYEFNSLTEMVTIPLKVRIDETLYYGVKTFTEGIKVEAYQNDTIFNSASMEIKATGNVTFHYSGGANPTSLLEGSTDEWQSMRYSIYRNGALYPNAFYYKEFIMEIPFIEGANITSFAKPSIATIDNENHKVIFKEFNRISENGPDTILLFYRAKYTDFSAGSYESTSTLNASLVMYDGKVINIPATTKMKILVKSKDDPTIPKALKLNVYSNPFYDLNDDYTGIAARIQMSNDAYSIKENTHLEYTFGDGYDPSFVGFPTNIPNIALDNIRYKTNLNTTIQSASGTKIITLNGRKGISTESLGLAPNEHITYVELKIGDIPKGAFYDGKDVISPVFMVLGRLPTGVNSANLTARVYSVDDNGDIIPETDVSSTGTINRTSKPHMGFNSGVSSSALNAGETKTITATLYSGVRDMGQGNAFENPTFYLRAIPNTTYTNINAWSGSKKLNTTVTGPYEVKGEQFYEVKVEGRSGYYFNNKPESSISLKYDIVTNVKAEGNYALNKYIFAQVDNVNYINMHNQPLATADIYDVNNNGDETEKILPLTNQATVQIASQKGINIDTYLAPVGEGRKPSYDGTDMTAVGFTPGTVGDYFIEVLNNTQNAAEKVDELETYIPIPKEGLDFGADLQNNAFNWNMKLNSLPTVHVYDAEGNDISAAALGKYEVSYSMDATNAGNYQSATYTTTPNVSDFPNIKMIKIKNITGMDAGERFEAKFNYVVDETAASAQGKLGKINDFRPYYRFKATGSAGWQYGTHVGAQLQVGEISGFAFKDLDYDGIYNNSDTALSGRTVKLFKKDGTGVYQDTGISETTDATGKYTFAGLGNGEYKVDFNSLVSTTEKFTLRKKGSDDMKDSDVQFGGAKIGVVEGLDPTADASKKVTVGVIDYEAPTVSVAPTTHTMKASNAQQTQTKQVTTTITPTYFNKIKATNDAIVWSSDTQTVATVDSNGIITAVSQGTATISVTVTDLYGNTDTASMVVTVESNDIPVITGDDAVTVKLGDSFVSRDDSGLSIQDTEDGTILVTDTTKVVVTGTVPVDATNKTTTLGTYTVKYVVMDNDGNTASKTILVNVTADGMPPVVDATVQVAANDFSLDFTNDADGNIEALGNTVTIQSVQAAANALGTNIVTAANGTITVAPLPTTVDATELTTIQTTTVPGVYPLTFTTTNGANTASKTIAVTLNDIHRPTTNGDATLYATNFTIEKTDLPLTSNDVVLHAAATAFETIKDNAGNVTAINPLTVTTKVADLAALNATEEDVVLVELSATSAAGYTVTKKIAVTVTNGGQPSATEDITLFGHNFTINATDAASLTVLQTLTKATATAYETTYDANHVVTNVINRSSAITVDTTQLATIQAAELGMYPLDLTVTSTDGTKTVSKTIIVTVKTTDDPSTNGNVSIFASDFSVQLGNQTTLTDAQAQTAAQVKAYELEYTTSMIQIQPLPATADTTELAAIQAATTAGVYPLTFTATNGTDIVTRTIVVTITNDGQPPIVSGQVQIVASDFSIKLDDVATVDGITAAGAVGTEIIKDATGNVTAINALPVTVDPTELSAIQSATQVGAYPLTFTTTNGTDTVSKTIVVTITKDGTDPIVNGNVQLSASDFNVDILDAATINGLTEAGAFAQEVITAAAGNLVTINPLTVSVDVTELTAVQSATQSGLYPLTFTATDGITTASKTIVVVVTQNGIEPTIVGSIYLMAHDFSVTLANVESVTGITEAQVVAVDVERDAFGSVTAINSITATVNVTELTAIQDAENQAIFPLTISATNGTDIASRQVNVEVISEAINYTLSAHNIEMSLSEMQAALASGSLQDKILTDSEAKVTNNITGTVKTTDIDVEIVDLTAPQVQTYDVVLSYDFGQYASFSMLTRTSDKVTTHITVTVKGDVDDTESGLPTTGEQTQVILLISLLMIIMSILTLILAKRKKQH